MNEVYRKPAPLWVTATLCISTLLFTVAAQAEQHPVLTSHVPEAVSSGVAP